MSRVIAERAQDSVHVLIFVSDIERSLKFYQGALGLEKEGEVHTPFGTSHRLRYGSSLIKLMEPARMPPAGPLGLDQQLGFRGLSLAVVNISALCASLEAQGVEFAIPETQVLPELRVAMVKDPDGNIVEFVQHTGAHAAAE